MPTVNLDVRSQRGATLLELMVTVMIAGIVLAAALVRGKGPIRLRASGWGLRPELLRTILRVGVPASLSPVLSNGSIAAATALIGSYGTAALAGYGVAARLESTWPGRADHERSQAWIDRQWGKVDAGVRAMAMVPALSCFSVGTISSGNKELLAFNGRLGFTEECRIKDAYPDGDMVVLSMTRDQCPWLKIKPSTKRPTDEQRQSPATD